RDWSSDVCSSDLARAHDAIDIEQRIFARLVLVHGQGVADIGADGDVIDVQDRQFVKAQFDQLGENLLVDLVAGFGIDLAGLEVDQVLGNVHAVQVLIDCQQVRQ